MREKTRQYFQHSLCYGMCDLCDNLSYAELPWRYKWNTVISILNYNVQHTSSPFKRTLQTELTVLQTHVFTQRNVTFSWGETNIVRFSPNNFEQVVSTCLWVVPKWNLPQASNKTCFLIRMSLPEVFRLSVIMGRSGPKNVFQWKAFVKYNRWKTYIFKNKLLDVGRSHEFIY